MSETREACTQRRYEVSKKICLSAVPCRICRHGMLIHGYILKSKAMVKYFVRTAVRYSC